MKTSYIYFCDACGSAGPRAWRRTDIPKHRRYEQIRQIHHVGGSGCCADGLRQRRGKRQPRRDNRQRQGAGRARRRREHHSVQGHPVCRTSRGRVALAEASFAFVVAVLACIVAVFAYSCAVLTSGVITVSATSFISGIIVFSIYSSTVGLAISFTICETSGFACVST